MSLCLLELVKEWIGILFVTISSLFVNNDSIDKVTVANNIENLNISTTAVAINYDTKKIYNDKISSGTENVITEGEVGIVYNIDGKEVKFREPVTEVIEVGTAPKGSYVGSITGYGADCPGCSGTVSCKTKNGSYNISKKGEYYDDAEYGNLRIVAADNSLFECGTVLDITSKNGEKINAIVLDTGSSLRSKWRNEGKVVVDVAFKTENDPEIYKITDRSDTVKFEVKRWGW